MSISIKIRLTEAIVNISSKYRFENKVLLEVNSINHK